MEEDIQEIVVGANLNRQSNQVLSYENKDYTFRGELKNYNYNNILRDKQTNINKLYELANYYVDADDIVSGIIKRVLVPFSLSCGWKLKGVSEKTKKKYIDHYEAISFLDVARSIFYELYLYAQCYIYFMPDGSMITLPPHKIRIADVMENGEPVLEYNIVEMTRKSTMAKEKFLDTLVEKYKGYPPEITAELLKGNAGNWVQLNPENTFILQESKPLWQKYAIPFISTCLKPLAKKELISYYEDVQLNIGAKGFLHVKVGHDELLPRPNKGQLDATSMIFQNALNKYPLAITSHFIDAKFIAVDTKGMFDKSKYTEVNQQIMASGGISSIVVTGESENSSFAQANLNVQTAAQRIKQNQDNFSEMMKKFNRSLALLWRIGDTRIPEFMFKDVNLSNDLAIKEEAFKLWQSGCMSNRTLLDDYYDMDYEQELERKTKEQTSGESNIFVPPINPYSAPASSGTGDSESGRPTKGVTDMKQDKNNSKSGANPKPSTQ